MDRKDNSKPLNEIRIGFRSRVRNIVNYANILLKENNFRSLNLSAIGGAIGSLVNAVEVLKITNPGLYQVNTIGTVAYQVIDQKGSVQTQRLYPKMEVTLTLDAPKENVEGSQDKMTEDERAKLLEVIKNRPPRKYDNERENRDGERGRGGFRGNRDGERGRGGFRGSRGAPRGRGGFRGNSRGGFRGSSRGGFRGNSRGEFRGSRGGFRGNNY